MNGYLFLSMFPFAFLILPVMLYAVGWTSASDKCIDAFKGGAIGLLTFQAYCLGVGSLQAIYG